VTPDEDAQPTLTTITVTPSYYGTWMGYTQRIDEQGYDPILSEMVGILGEQAGLSVDTLVRNDLTDNATTDFSAGITARTSLDNSLAHEISFDDILIQIAELENLNARPVEGGMFACVVHPYTWKNLLQDETFMAAFVEEAPNTAIRTGMLGKLMNCVFYMSSNARVYTDGGVGTTDVYDMLFIGADSHGVVGFASQMPNLNPTAAPSDYQPGGNTGGSVNSVEIIRKGLGETGFDPLNQRGTLGWKTAFGVQVTQANWIRNLEHLNDFS
jgi:N4-gp56 family major capsid protein